ncbi:MAG: zinc ribbon domain-containing protein [Gammaproteobacteria bacterium]|jgi:putative FmdB family regulatory protein|nr:zinc ribbon domain-containing protein [Gammaproteobacteria bacterium]
MPIYEYQCAACGHHLESLQKISDEPLRECPACGKPELKKQLSAAGFRLKGTGWYETDFKGKSGEKKGAPAKGAGKAPAKSDAKSGETKSGETKSGETKSGETKSSGTKNDAGNSH